MRASIFFVIALVVPSISSAATLYFDPQERTVGRETPFQIAVLIDAPVAVNAFDVAVRIPEGLIPIQTSDGGSLINFWIDAPRFDVSTRILHFSGIVPGGFVGSGARLMTISLRAAHTGVAHISFDATTQVRRNTADAAREPLTLRSLALLVQDGRENIENPIPDTEPPLPFVPAIIHDASIERGAPLLVFATQDMGSGIVQYDVAESLDRDPAFATWIRADSPYRIHDTSLSSWLFVRATDAMGNTRTETVQPSKYDSFSGLLHRTFATFILLCLILMLYARIRPRRTL